MKGVLSCLLALVLVFSITPSVFAEGGKTIYVDATNGDDTLEGVGTTSDTAYKTVAEAVAAADSGDTIMLAAGTYTLYGKDGVATNKSLTFVGADTQETTWNIGTLENDAYSQSNGDYGFRGAHFPEYDAESRCDAFRNGSRWAKLYGLRPYGQDDR